MYLFDIDTICFHVCNKAKWSLSSLALQRILYLAEVDFTEQVLDSILLDDQSGLIDSKYLATTYGPILPLVNDKTKSYGADFIDHIFYNANTLQKNSFEDKFLDLIINKYANFSYAKLLSLTHWDKGAWNAKYNSRLKTPINRADIIDEAKNRTIFSEEWSNLLNGKFNGG